MLEKLARALDVSVSAFSEETAQSVTVDGLPPGLVKFLETRGRELGVRKSDVELLESIRFRGRQPDDPRDWEFLFLCLERWAR